MGNYHIKKSKVIRTVGQLKKLADRMNKIEEFAYDTETNTLRVYGDNPNFKLVGISISWGAYHNYYIPTGHVFDKGQLKVRRVVEYLKPIFEREDITIVGHNLKFDMHVLARIGINIKTPKLFDTMIASWICDENEPKGLKENSQRILNISQEHFADTLATVTKEQKLAVGLKASNKATFDMVSIENGSPYALDDAYYTWELYLYYLDKLVSEKMDKIYYKTYPQFLVTLYRMEERGITVDIPKLKQMGVSMQKDLDELEYELLELAGVQMNINSSQELIQLLFGYSEGFKTIKQALLDNSFSFPIVSSTAKGKPQVNGDVLKALSKKSYSTKRKKEGVEFCKLLLEYKKLSKLKTAFVDGLLEQLYDDGKAHPSFNIVGTDSGRVSCISEDTPITVVGGYKKIQDIKVGDKVYCYDDEGNLKISTVKRVINNGIRNCIKVNWRSLGKHDRGSLICTPDHKIRLASGEWVRADSLTPNTRLSHLRRSKVDSRPRMYGLNNLREQEQIIIKQEHFKDFSSDNVIHHIDGNKSNNLLDNLVIMDKKEHSKYHTNQLVREGRIKHKHLYDGSCERFIPRGKENGSYKEFTKEELENMVHQSKGKIREIPIDFDTFKKKCKEVGYEYKKTASMYQKQYKEVTREEFEKAFFECEGVAYKIQEKLGIGRPKCKKLIKEYDLCYNHSVVDIEKFKEMQVYDLEIEDYHNFIASEICVHNCSSPNLMQLPNAEDDDKYQIRDCFIGSIDPKTNKRKHIISIDYSNLEVRVMAHFSKDPNLIQAFLDGKDLHGNTAKMMFRLDCDANEVKKLYPKLRQQGKVIAFLLQYGGSAMTLYADLNKDGELDRIAKEQCNDKKSDFYGCKKGKDVAQRLMDLYFKGFKGIADFMKSQKKFAHRNLYVNTLVGRKRRLPDINSNNYGTVGYCERLSINACIQGSGADIMINAQNRIEGTNNCNVTQHYLDNKYNNPKQIKPFSASEKLKELDCEMLVQIHDELLLECPEENCEEAMQIIRDCMIHPFGEKVKLNLPLEVGMAYSESYQGGH